MNRTVHTHIKNIMPDNPDPDAPVFLGGGTRPNNRFRTLCGLAGIEAKTSVETEEKQPWVLRDLRKTCATYYDEHIPESSVEILGHSAGGVTYRHYAHRAPLAFKAIMTLSQPSAFSALVKGFDGTVRAVGDDSWVLHCSRDVLYFTRAQTEGDVSPASAAARHERSGSNIGLSSKGLVSQLKNKGIS